MDNTRFHKGANQNDLVNGQGENSILENTRFHNGATKNEQMKADIHTVKIYSECGVNEANTNAVDTAAKPMNADSDKEIIDSGSDDNPDVKKVANLERALIQDGIKCAPSHKAADTSEVILANT
eukprot:4438388-Pyramimonas_sp.AAC.1